SRDCWRKRAAGQAETWRKHFCCIVETFSDRSMRSLKGSNIIAEGNALGALPHDFSRPERAEQNRFFVLPFQGAESFLTTQPEGVALGYDVSGFQPEVKISINKLELCAPRLLRRLLTRLRFLRIHPEEHLCRGRAGGEVGEQINPDVRGFREVHDRHADGHRRIEHAAGNAAEREG